MAFEGLTDKLNAVFSRIRQKGKLSESDVNEAMREVRRALLEADVNFLVAKKFIKAVTQRAIGEEVMQSLTPGQQVIKIVNDELTNIMGKKREKILYSSNPPTIIMLCGLQGAGKTTMCAKLAKHMKEKDNRRPMIAACDIYRPAAIDQLKVVGEQAGVPVFELGQENPVKIAKEALRAAKKGGRDVLIVDTAGRLHIDNELMNELKDIKKAIKPDEILLVIDAMTGQDAVNAAKAFDETISIDGTILTKLDGDARGGAALSVREVTGKSIKYVGVGEKLDDIEPFHPERMASRILGMGDMMTLIEKAQESFNEENAKSLNEKMRKASFTLEDFLQQFEQVNKMGGMGALMKMMPGTPNIDENSIDNKQIEQTKAIILSMTPKERRNPKVLNASRKRRISKGCGMQVQDINRLLKQFEMIKKMMKQMSGKGRGKRGNMPFNMPF